MSISEHCESCDSNNMEKANGAQRNWEGDPEKDFDNDN